VVGPEERRGGWPRGWAGLSVGIVGLAVSRERGLGGQSGRWAGESAGKVGETAGREGGRDSRPGGWARQQAGRAGGAVGTKGASHAIRRMAATRLQACTKPSRAHCIREKSR